MLFPGAFSKKVYVIIHYCLNTAYQCFSSFFPFYWNNLNHSITTAWICSFCSMSATFSPSQPMTGDLKTVKKRNYRVKDMQLIFIFCFCTLDCHYPYFTATHLLNKTHVPSYASLKTSDKYSAQGSSMQSLHFLPEYKSNEVCFPIWKFIFSKPRNENIFQSSGTDSVGTRK